MSANNIQIKPNKKARKMSDEMTKRAYRLFSVASTKYNETLISMFIIKELHKMGISFNVDGYNNILISKGKGNKPCFCAHLDTVHLYNNGFNVYLRDNFILARDKFNKQVGVGGDDKCGIFACLELLKTIDNIKIVFFSREESGGTGSSGVDLDFFDDCIFLASIDRWNGKDFITSYIGSTISKEFKNDVTPLLNKYGYSENSGMFTDCFNVMDRGVGLSCFNISCGYYSHHSDSEIVDLNELNNCIDFCKELCELTTIYTHYNTKYDFDYNYAYAYDGYCQICGLELLSGEIDICDRCTKEYDKCEICGTKLEDAEEIYYGICKNC